MTVYARLLSLIAGPLPDAEPHVGGASSTGSSAPQASDSMPTDSVLCARVSVKWMRQNRIGVEVRCGGQLAWAQSTRVPVSRLVVHAESLSEADLLTAVQLRVGQIVVGSPAFLVGLHPPADQRSQDVLIRTPDDSHVTSRGRVGLDMAAVDRVVEHPLLHLAGLHADIGCREGAFVSLPAAIGQLIADMADIRDRRGIVLSRVSMGIQPGVLGIARSVHAAVIQSALRDACQTFSFPMPSTVVSSTTSTVGRSAA